VLTGEQLSKMNLESEVHRRPINEVPSAEDPAHGNNIAQGSVINFAEAVLLNRQSNRENAAQAKHKAVKTSQSRFLKAGTPTKNSTLASSAMPLQTNPFQVPGPAISHQKHSTLTQISHHMLPARTQAQHSLATTKRASLVEELYIKNCDRANQYEAFYNGRFKRMEQHKAQLAKDLVKQQKKIEKERKAIQDDLREMLGSSDTISYVRRETPPVVTAEPKTTTKALMNQTVQLPPSSLQRNNHKQYPS